MTVAAIVSIAGNMGSTVLMAPRYLFALALLLSLALLAGARPANLLAGAIALAAGTIIYRLRRLRAARSGR